MNGNTISARDCCSEDGVAHLQRKIRERWAPHVVKFTTLAQRFNMAVRACRWDLRSDMVNGLPRGLYEERKQRQGRAR